MKKVAAGEFKVTCLELRDQVAAARPGVEAPQSIFGAAKGRFLYLASDEQLLSTGEVWNAEG